jgi:ATP-dependent RNA helicase DDX5/DBP2
MPVTLLSVMEENIAARKAERKAERKAMRKAQKKAQRKAERKAAQKDEHESLDATVDEKGKRKVAADDMAAKRARLDPTAATTTAAKLDSDSDSAATATPAAAAAAYLAAHEITIHDDEAPPPCLSLAEAPFPPALLKLLTSQPFTAPSPVQAATWPIAVSGRDVLAIAKTGSGKTLGFLLPVLARCVAERPAAKGTPLGIIMAPTRELALQIHADAAKYGAVVSCRAVAVYGGASKDAQVRALQRGCELIIGTPGRIKDVLDVRGGGASSHVDVSKMSMVVLDEADRMLDMGFETDIRSIVWQCFRGVADAYRPHQTFLYSATWPAEVRSIAADLLSDDAVKVTVGSGGEKLTASKSIIQRVHVVDATKRWDAFVGLIAPFGKGGAHAKSRVIVFANRKDTVKALARHCQDQGMACDVLSGDRSQSQRESTLRKFKEGTVTIVIATDVAARGLDIKGIERVINYELPADDFQDYVHRIGRTGRASATGEADSLFTEADKLNAKELIRILTEAGQTVPPALAKLTPQRVVFD